MQRIKRPKKSKKIPIYQESFKREFIDYKGQSYVASAEALFRRSFHFEQALKRDLYSFSLSEIEQIFTSSKSKKAQNDYNVIKSYLEFCVDKGLISTYVLEGKNLRYFENFLDKDRLRIKEEDLNKYISYCYNEQDRLILRLLFEGVNGKRHSELFNLRREDIDWKTNTLNLYCDETGHRQLTVSSECIRLIDLTIKQDAFYFNNGQESKRRPYEYYCKSNYIIRTLNREVQGEYKRADLTFLNSRFLSFKKWFKEEKLSPTVINKSGMLSYAIKLSKQYGIHVSKFKHDTHWRIVAEKFPMKSRITNGTFQYESLFRYIDLEEIDVLYGNYLGDNFILQSDEGIKKEIIEKKKRESAPRFRRMIINIYNGKCAITNEDTLEVLEASHIQDYKNDNSNHHQNGLLLRADLHKLFDVGLVRIDEDYTVIVDDRVTSEYYRRYNGICLRLPKDNENYPSKDALRDHNEQRKTLVLKAT